MSVTRSSPEDFRDHSALSVAELYPLLRAWTGTHNAGRIPSATTPDQQLLNTLVDSSDENKVLVDCALLLETLGWDKQLGKKQRRLIGCRQLEGELREQQLLDQLQVMCGALNHSNIEYCLLKGAALVAGRYTATPGQRHFADIDILVSPVQLDAAYSALTRAGFVSGLVLKEPVSAYWNSKHLPPLQSASYRYAIECHQRPFEHTFKYDAPFSAEEMLAERVRCSIGETESFMPSPEHLLLSTFYHAQLFDVRDLSATDHHRSMLDLSLIVRKHADSLDWRKINAIVESKKYQKPFNRFVGRAVSLFDPELASISGYPAAKCKRNWLERLFGRNSRIGKLVINWVTHSREIVRASSAGGQLERKMLLEANPDNWKYQPIYRQLLNPELLKKRLEYFFSQS